MLSRRPIQRLLQSTGRISGCIGRAEHPHIDLAFDRFDHSLAREQGCRGSKDGAPKASTVSRAAMPEDVHEVIDDESAGFDGGFCVLQATRTLVSSPVRTPNRKSPAPTSSASHPAMTLEAAPRPPTKPTAPERPRRNITSGNGAWRAWQANSCHLVI